MGELSAQDSKLICTFLTVILSGFFGYLPVLLNLWCTSKKAPGYGTSGDGKDSAEAGNDGSTQGPSPEDPSPGPNQAPGSLKGKKKKNSRKDIFMSLMLNFGGGVLVANAFCHWIPEVREGLEVANAKTFLPLSEVIVCSGFFAMCLLEEIIHRLLRKIDSPWKETKDKSSVCPAPQSHLSGPTGGFARCKLSEEIRKPLNNKCLDGHDCKQGAQNTGGVPANRAEPRDLRNGANKVLENADAIKDVAAIHVEIMEEAEEEEQKNQVFTTIRTFFTIFALSFHSIVEGLAMGLEGDVNGVWVNFGVICLHKFVIAFSIGVELLASCRTRLQYFISIAVFSAAPAIGSAIGIVMSSRHEVLQDVYEVPIQALQGITTGAVLYVVFFEIFPKAKAVGGSGIKSVVAMILGFLSFLPSIIIHSGEGDHKHE